MNRCDIINYYLRLFPQFRSYLEIGVGCGESFNAAEAFDKDGIDIDVNSKCNYHMSSDDFFQMNQKKYNVVFIDGLHHCDQVCRDINNSLDCLQDNGIIIVHDCIPENEVSQKLPQQNGNWVGTVWKAFVLFRCVRQDLEMFVIDTDWGVGVIKPHRRQKLYAYPEIISDYNLFANCKHEALNIISVEEWLARRDTNRSLTT